MHSGDKVRIGLAILRLINLCTELARDRRGRVIELEGTIRREIPKIKRKNEENNRKNAELDRRVQEQGRRIEEVDRKSAELEAMRRRLLEQQAEMILHEVQEEAWKGDPDESVQAKIQEIADRLDRVYNPIILADLVKPSDN